MKQRTEEEKKLNDDKCKNTPSAIDDVE